MSWRLVSRAGAAVALAALVALGGSGCGSNSGRLEVRWTIGGLQPASARTDPWIGIEASLDRCSEVGATHVDIHTLDGPNDVSGRVPCATTVVGSGGATLELQRHTFTSVTLGHYQLAAYLLDGNAERLTRTVIVDTDVTSRAGVARVNFDAGVFRDASDRPIVKTGTYQFVATYAGGASCDRMEAPAPQMQYVRLLDAASAVVRARVCAGRQCTDTTRSAPLPCVPSGTTQTIADLPWGSYRLELWSESARGTTCWAADHNIVVGAGDNPTAAHDLAQTACP